MYLVFFIYCKTLQQYSYSLTKLSDNAMDELACDRCHFRKAVPQSFDSFLNPLMWIFLTGRKYLLDCHLTLFLIYHLKNSKFLYYCPPKLFLNIYRTRNRWQGCIVMYHFMYILVDGYYIGEFGGASNCILFTWLGWMESWVVVSRPNNVSDLIPKTVPSKCNGYVRQLKTRFWCQIKISIRL